MRTQVYAVVHDGQKNFLLAIKNMKGYFFHNPKGGGTIVPNGQPLNGGGSWALPGGELTSGTPQDGALQEFFEETNIQLTNYTLQPPAYRGTEGTNWQYYGVYFDVGDQLQTLEGSVQTNLDIESKASDAVKDGQYGVGQYDQLRQAFPGCPMDDELDSVDIWNLNTNWAEIQSWQQNPKLNWY